MKYVLITICLMVVMLLVVPVRSEATEPNGPNQPKLVTFCGVPWGGSVEQIKEKMGRDPNIINPDAVIYTPIKIVGLDAGAMFIVKRKQFLRGVYVFIEKHSYKNAYLRDFDTVEKALTTKYGEPTECRVFWSNKLFKDDPSQWGLAMSIGHLTYFTIWDVGEVKITHVCSGDEYQITHRIEYSQKQMSELENAIDEEDNNAKL